MKTNQKIILGFILVIILMIIDKYLFTNYLNYSELLKKSLIDEGLTEEHISLTESIQDWTIPISILVNILTILFIAGFLYLGCVLNNYNRNFKKIFIVSFISYGIIIVSKIVSTLWLNANLEDIKTLTYLKKFTALSLQNFYNYTSVSDTIFEVLGELNLFRVLFWFALTYGLKLIINKPFWKSFEIVFLFNITIFILIVLGKFLIGLNFS